MWQKRKLKNYFSCDITLDIVCQSFECSGLPTMHSFSRNCGLALSEEVNKWTLLLPAESEGNSDAATSAKEPKWAVAGVLCALTPRPRPPSPHYCGLCALDRTRGTPFHIFLNFSSARSTHCRRDKICFGPLGFQSSALHSLCLWHSQSHRTELGDKAKLSMDHSKAGLLQSPKKAEDVNTIHLNGLMWFSQHSCRAELAQGKIILTGQKRSHETDRQCSPRSSQHGTEKAVLDVA